MARTQTRSTEDLATFLEVASYVGSRKSLREVADAMRMAQQTVSDLLARLESQLQTVLIERPPNARVLRISPAGEELIRRLSSCIEPLDRPARQPITIRLAHSLMSSRLVRATMERFDASCRGQAREEGARDTLRKETGFNTPKSTLRLSSGSELDDARETENLRSGELDLLLCWALPQRLRKWERESGVRIKQIGPAYQVAAVSHNRSIIDSCFDLTGNPDFSQIVTYRCAVLDHDKQPMDEQLVNHGIYFLLKNRLQVSTFHAVVEVIRARIADIGIVPLVGSDLDFLQATQEVFFRPISPMYKEVPTTLRIGAVYRTLAQGDLASEANERTKRVEELVEDLDASLGHSRKSLTWSPVLRSLPKSPEFYSRLVHGYYLYRSDDELTAGAKESETAWLHERITNLQLRAENGLLLLQKPKGSLNKEETEFAHIKNEVEETYRIEDARVVDGAFFLVARASEAKVGQAEPHGFISVFNAAVEAAESQRHSQNEPVPAIIVGLWNGGGGRKSAISAWSTVFSSVELSQATLNSIARTAALSLTLVAANVSDVADIT